MVLTVTLNPAIDKIFILNHFEIHMLHRLEEGEISMVSPGGKGVNIAQNLKRLGSEVVATGFAGGHSGHMLCDKLRQEGITTSFVFTNSNTRTNTSILDRQNETLTEINDEGLPIEEEDIVFFLENYERLLSRVNFVVIAGSIPQGVSEDIFLELISLAKKYNKKTIIHTQPIFTDKILEGSPYIIHPDMRSHHNLLGKEVDGISDFLSVGKHILTRCPETEWVLFTHRIENVVAIARNKSYIVRPKNLKIVNMLGYGDAYLSGFIHAYKYNYSDIEKLKYASACGLTDVEDLYKEIRNIELVEKNLSRIEVEVVE